LDAGPGGTPGGGRTAVASFRLLVTEPLDGASNMAIDEALLRARLTGESPPTIRFFGWAPPAVSLGYGQALDGAIDLAACLRLGIGLVRRPTGGSALLHETPDAELTYSVVARGGDFPGADDLLETYRVIGTGLAAGLRRLGAAAEVVPLVRQRRGPTPTFCFARTGSYEIAAGGKKLVGSAQRRQGGGLLQHGSLLLTADPARLRAVFPYVEHPLAGVATLGAVLGRSAGFDEVAAALAAGMAEVLGSLLPGDLMSAETALVDRLVAEKYGTTEWTHHGRVPVTSHA
jgi:lipoate-protein ligase A